MCDGLRWSFVKQEKPRLVANVFYVHVCGFMYVIGSLEKTCSFNSLVRGWIVLFVISFLNLFLPVLKNVFSI